MLKPAKNWSWHSLRAAVTMLHGALLDRRFSGRSRQNGDVLGCGHESALMQVPSVRIEALSRTLRRLHAATLTAEKQFHPVMGELEFLDRLLKDPAWAWLRALSALIADMDHVLAQDEPPTEYDVAVAAGHVRELLDGTGAANAAAFVEHYRPLLQLSPELVSVHGELKSWLKNAPVEPVDEAERLHHRHQWVMRLKHRTHP
jgi:hypothetical protein